MSSSYMPDGVLKERFYRSLIGDIAEVLAECMPKDFGKAPVRVSYPPQNTEFSLLEQDWFDEGDRMSAELIEKQESVHSMISERRGRRRESKTGLSIVYNLARLY